MDIQQIKHNFKLGKMDLSEIEWLINTVEQYQLQETYLLGRLEKLTLEYKQLKQDRRLIAFYEMAEENLRLAQELANLKAVMSG